MARTLSALTLCVAFFACSQAEQPVMPRISDPEQIVPSPSMPSDVAIQAANNNLDIVRHDGRVFFAFRTAPGHFASPMADLVIVSSTDERTWTREASFNRQTDLREPRFFSFDGKLFLYFAVLGESAIRFEPQGMMVTEYRGPGDWSEPEWVYMPGFIPWRAKVENGTAYVVAYAGGENLYNGERQPTDIHWLKTTDGRNFTPAAGEEARVEGGGGSETDFVIRADGSLVAIIRNEEGDDLGWGSKICRAEPGALGDWHCIADPRKYDSPLLFRHGNGVYLIGRRNISETGGLYDLGKRDKEDQEETLYYQLDYSGHPKRCALWSVDGDAMKVKFLLDLPSRGDTCFPGILPLGGNDYAVYNYSSALEGPDLIWLEGQLAPTNIYRVVLSF